MNYSRYNVKVITLFRWVNPSPIDFAPYTPILLNLLKENYLNKKCLIKMNPNINIIICYLNFIMNYSKYNVKVITFLRWVNPLAIDFAPYTPILFSLLKDYK